MLPQIDPARACIIGVKPGHDGGVAVVENGELLLSLEGEKNSFQRYAPLHSETLRAIAGHASRPPDIVAWGGWFKFLNNRPTAVGAGYAGLAPGRALHVSYFGAPVVEYHGSHERSHLFGVAAMAPFAPVEDAVILLWEGQIGAIYRWRGYGSSIDRHHVLSAPGGRYAALYGLADPAFPDEGQPPPSEAAGKVMALAAYGRIDPEPLRPAERRAIDHLLSVPRVYPFKKAELRDSPLYNCGPDSPPVHRAAAYLTDRLFEIFVAEIKQHRLTGLPLLITGGCGLNCEWNSRLVESKLFSDVFVAPTSNDSGSAFGVAADALATVTRGPLKIEWSVDRGLAFEWDVDVPTGWTKHLYAPQEVARELAAGCVVAWIDGRHEIGPRALGRRSLLATPTRDESRAELNRIKGREAYRPVAPCCMEQHLSRWFDPARPDEHMLYFSRVMTDGLPAITHVDGTARVQSVPAAHRHLHGLLAAFESETGYGVLCNTSLNYRGAGFINRASDLFEFCDEVAVRNAVIDGAWYKRT